VIRGWKGQVDHGESRLSVSSADSTRKGLAAFGKGTFDLMIVEVFMPQMRGFEAIRLFRRRPMTVPRIASYGSVSRRAKFSPWKFSGLPSGFGALRHAPSPQAVHVPPFSAASTKAAPGPNTRRLE